MALTTEDLDQIKNIVKEAVAPLSTKAELDRFATKADLDLLATKADLDRIKARLTTSIGLLERDSFSRLDQHEARITRLEQARP